MIKKEKEFIDQLIKEYSEGSSLKELDAKYHTDSYYHLKKVGFKRRSHWEQYTITRTNCYKLNWDCSSISNETEAYILGLLYADGYVSHNQVGLRLKYTDKEIIEKVKNYFSKDIKLQYSEKSKTYSFVVSSYKICRNLNKLGLLSKKTNFDFNMPIIPDKLYSHFIRGYFDGDGSIFVCNAKNNKYLKSNICSPTISILKDFETILKSNDIQCSINIEKRKNKIMRCPNGLVKCSFDMYRLFIRKKSSLLKFYHFLYDDSTIFMSRKKLVFDNNFYMLEYIHANTEVN